MLHNWGLPQIFSLFWRILRFSHCWVRTGHSEWPFRPSPQTRSCLRTWRAPGSPRSHCYAPCEHPRSDSASCRWKAPSAPRSPSSFMLGSAGRVKLQSHRSPQCVCAIISAWTGLNTLSSEGFMEMSCASRAHAFVGLFRPVLRHEATFSLRDENSAIKRG